jgi:hypothetical protein
VFEVAAEIMHFMKKKVSIYDANPRVLFQLPLESAHYAEEFFINGEANLYMEKGFPNYLERQNDPDVLSCVGIQSECNQFLPLSVLDQRKYVKINRAMQVLQPKKKDDELKDGEAVQHEIVDGLFACGDCVSLDGAPKTLFVAQEMAAIVVSNIEALEGHTIDLPNVSDFSGVDTAGSDMSEGMYKGKEMRVLHDDMPFPFCASLGPADGIFAMNSTQFGGQTLMTGKVAAVQKQLIEDTTLGSMKENTLCKMIWAPVH